MDPPRRLRLEPRPSRAAAFAFALAGVATTGVLLTLPLGTAGRLAAVAGAVIAIDARLRALRRAVPALIHLGLDRRIAVTTGDGHTREGSVLASSYVGSRVVTVVWRPDGCPWWRPAPALLLLPDMLGAEDHRQLRVALRCGRAPPAAGRAASYDPAGPTVSAARPATRAISGEAAG